MGGVPGRDGSRPVPSFLGIWGSRALSLVSGSRVVFPESPLVAFRSFGGLSEAFAFFCFESVRLFWLCAPAGVPEFDCANRDAPAKISVAMPVCSLIVLIGGAPAINRAGLSPHEVTDETRCGSLC